MIGGSAGYSIGGIEVMPSRTTYVGSGWLQGVLAVPCRCWCLATDRKGAAAGPRCKFALVITQQFRLRVAFDLACERPVRREMLHPILRHKIARNARSFFTAFKRSEKLVGDR